MIDALRDRLCLRRSRETRRRVLILGGGFGGLNAALALDAKRYDVTVVDRRRHFEFLPNIHELVSGVKTSKLLRLPLEANLAQVGHSFLHEEVTAIDVDAREVSTRSGERLEYDALIVAFGGADSGAKVPGFDEHAIGFKSVEQCARIGERLTKLVERPGPASVVIIGGGLEGIEALGEILRRHRERNLRITLVDGGDRLLAEAPEALDPHIRKLCSRWPVTFEMGQQVERIEAGAVVLENGDSLDSDLTIWTGGPAPPQLLAESGLASANEWASVNESLQSRAHPEVFVVGDGAALPDALSKQAYHALDMGACAARNVDRFLSGRRLETFRASEKPTLVSFGDLSCFLVAGDRVLAGAPLAAAKEAVFEAVMTQLDARRIGAQLPRIVKRASRAADQLLWPALQSPGTWLEQGKVSLL